MAEEKVEGPEFFGVFITLEGEGNDDGGALGFDGFQVPCAEAGEAVGGGVGVIFFGTEPGEADGDSAADGFVGEPGAFGAEPEDVFAAGKAFGFPGGDVGSVEIDGSFRA